MKVLIVSPAFPPYSGVGGMRMGSLASYLRDQGVQVHVVRNLPTLWGEHSLKSEVPANLHITDVNANQDFKGNGRLYAQAIAQVLDQHPIDVIVYSVGPFYTLLALRQIAKTHPHKQLIDFRDLWTYQRKATVGFVNQLKALLLKGLYRTIERPAVNLSDGIVVVTPGDERTMRQKYPKLKNRIVTIFNGYEPITFSPAQRPQTDTSLQLVSLGKLGYYAPHLAGALFEALSELQTEGIVTRLVHVGQPEPSVQAAQTRYPQVDYRNTGYMDYKDGLQVAYESDVAVIVMNHPTAYGTKVFDYIACNKPILLVTEDAAQLSELVTSFKHGVVCATAHQIKDAIRHFHSQQLTTLDEQLITQQYSRSKQNDVYLQHLRQVINNR